MTESKVDCTLPLPGSKHMDEFKASRLANRRTRHEARRQTEVTTYIGRLVTNVTGTVRGLKQMTTEREYSFRMEMYLGGLRGLRIDGDYRPIGSISVGQDELLAISTQVETRLVNDLINFTVETKKVTRNIRNLANASTSRIEVWFTITW